MVGIVPTVVLCYTGPGVEGWAPGKGGSVAKIGPFQVKTVRGEPILAGDRTLIPVTRVVSFGQARATIGRSRHSGWGGGFVWVRPVAMLVDTTRGQQRIRIADGTAAAVRRLIWLGVGITAMGLAVGLARPRHR
jgi:hypothetical protein